jgi:peptidoglycan-N-acetylglucosamine deacetylase
MVDLVAFFLLVLVLGGVAYALWRAVRGPAGSRSAAAAAAVACLALALLVAGVVSFQFSKARTLQLFGEIVPRVEVADSVVALTFDDGPAPAATDRILEILDAYGVRATFYLNGEAIDAHPASARRIVDAGHEVGNHGYTHTSMLGLSLARLRDEVERTDAQIRRAGYEGEIHFRSPYGKKFVALPWYLARTGRKNVFWDVEPESHPEVAREAGRIAEHVVEKVQPGSIVLLHVMSRSRVESMEAVPGIIEALHERGYRFVTVSELLARAAR